MRKSLLAALLAASAAVAACGDTAGEQALYGAGAGAVGSALLNGNLVTGAALGAAGNLFYCQQKPHRR